MQAQLDLKVSAPKIAPEDVERLVSALDQAGGRMSGTELAERIYGQGTEGLKRRVRAIAKAARPRVVSFPGSDGYQLWERCTIEEIQHGIEALESQGKDMIREANIFRMALHRGFRGPKADDANHQFNFQ